MGEKNSKILGKIGENSRLERRQSCGREKKARKFSLEDRKKLVGKKRGLPPRTSQAICIFRGTMIE